MPVWLLALLFAAFVLYTDDYVIAGVLPEIAEDLGVSQAQAGQLVTVFSVTVALAAPVAGVGLAGVDRRRVFGVSLAVFVAANILAALTPSYGALVVLRVVAALAAAATTPSLFAVAAVRAPEGRTGRYIAVVALGVTGSIAAGVPIGTWVGGALGWRATFALMAVLGAAAAALILATLERAEQDGPPPSLTEQLRVLAAPAVSLGLAANALFMTGSMMLMTYLAPFTVALSGADTTARGALFAFSGLAGMLGIWAGGLAADRWGPDRALATGVGAFLAAMAALAVLWGLRPVPVWTMGAVSALLGAAAFFTSPAIQARLHALAGPVAPQALALNTSGTYLGVAGGGAVGGVLLAAFGPGALPAASAGFGVCALLSLALAVRLDRRGRVAVT